MLGVGTRFQDFTTGSWSLFANPARTLVSLNTAAYDAEKHGAMPVQADAKVGLGRTGAALAGHAPEPPDTGAEGRLVRQPSIR